MDIYIYIYIYIYISCKTGINNELKSIVKLISSDCDCRVEDKKNVIKNKIKINTNLKLENH